MAEFIVRGDREQDYVAAMARALPYEGKRRERGWRDKATKAGYAAVQDPEFGLLICGGGPQQSAEEQLQAKVWGAFPLLSILPFLWPLLQPVIVAVVKRLIEYWRNRPQAVEAIQTAARRS